MIRVNRYKVKTDEDLTIFCSKNKNQIVVKKEEGGIMERRAGAAQETKKEKRVGSRNGRPTRTNSSRLLHTHLERDPPKCSTA